MLYLMTWAFDVGVEVTTQDNGPEIVRDISLPGVRAFLHRLA